MSCLLVWDVYTHPEHLLLEVVLVVTQGTLEEVKPSGSSVFLKINKNVETLLLIPHCSPVLSENTKPYEKYILNLPTNFG